MNLDIEQWRNNMNLDINPNEEIPENYTNWPRSASEPSQLPSTNEWDTNAANALVRGSKRVFDVEIISYSFGDGFEQYSVVLTNDLFNGDKTDPNSLHTRIPTNVTSSKEFAEHIAATWCDFLGVEQKYKYIV